MVTPAQAEAEIRALMAARVEAVRAKDAAALAAHQVAFCHGLHHVSGTPRDGRKIDMFWRATQGFQRIDGAWRVVHEHGSLPFDMKTGKVPFSLKP
jgi:PhnB protein